MGPLFWESALVHPVANMLGLPEIIAGFLVLLLIVWTIYLKAGALWEAAKHGQRIWFVVFLVVHTVGILELIYLIWFRKDALPRHAHIFPLPDFEEWKLKARGKK